jgi:hypothetical protein
MTPLLEMLLGLGLLLFGILILLVVLVGTLMRVDKKLAVLDNLDWQTLNLYMIRRLRNEI